MNFFFRHPAYCVKNPRKAYATTKAMRAHRKAHPTCAFTGRTPVHVHHIEPIQFAPDRAADPANFISLYPKAHLVVGHGGDWKQYVANVRALCAQAAIGRACPEHSETAVAQEASHT